MGETNRMRLAGALAVVALTGAACANSDAGAGGLTGSIIIDGSSTVAPISEAVQEEFRLENPGVEIAVGTSGTGGGFEKFCSADEADRTDVQDASRPIKTEGEGGEPSEADLCADNGVEYVELTVALDGLAVVAHPDVDWIPDDCLTVEHLKAIWEPGSKVDSWRDVDASFPDVAIKLFGPGTDSGTFDYFTDEINGEEGAIRSQKDWTPSENDNDLVTGVGGTRGALGYFGYAYYAQSADRLKLISVDAGDGCVAPSDETVKDGSYTPLSRPLFIYVNTGAAARPEVAAFVSYYMGSVGDLLSDVGYTPLDDAALAEEVAEWEAATA